MRNGLNSMGAEGKYDAESLQHIFALLQKHDIPEILKMALDVTRSRTLIFLCVTRVTMSEKRTLSNMKQVQPP